MGTRCSVNCFSAKARERKDELLPHKHWRNKKQAQGKKTLHLGQL